MPYVLLRALHDKLLAHLAALPKLRANPNVIVTVTRVVGSECNGQAKQN